MATIDKLAQVIHGSPAGYAAGCRSEGGCPNHGSRSLLTCVRAARARNSNFQLARLDPSTPISKAMNTIPKERSATAHSELPSSPRRPRRAKKDPTVKTHVTSAAQAAAAVKQLSEPPARRPRPKPAAKAVRPPVHGTDYGWQRGCKTDEGCPNSSAGGTSCLQAHLAYHREYRRARKAGSGPSINHGTPHGYQLGCHDRTQCPGGPEGTTCADASLAQERRRRREAGIAPAKPLTPSAPAVEHIAKLRAAKLSIAAIVTASSCSRTAIRSLIYGRDDYQNGAPGPRHGQIPSRIDEGKARRILEIPLPNPVRHLPTHVLEHEHRKAS